MGGIGASVRSSPLDSCRRQGSLVFIGITIVNPADDPTSYAGVTSPEACLWAYRQELAKQTWFDATTN
jgi:hypothetical protein